MTRHLGRALIALTCLLAFQAAAVDRLGPAQPIVEPDFIDQIQQSLKEKEKSGELAKLQKESVERVKRSAEEPQPVAGLERTREPRTFFYDPSFTQQKGIFDNQGRQIVAAGTTVNPLQYITLSSRMLFFDGRDSEQVKKAFSLIEKYKDGVKPVLVGGQPLEMMRKRKVRIYFDQGGILVRRFGIKQVPALVSQDGYRIRIEEMGVKL